jgi:hypothetical protein
LSSKNLIDFDRNQPAGAADEQRRECSIARSNLKHSGLRDITESFHDAASGLLVTEKMLSQLGLANAPTSSVCD